MIPSNWILLLVVVVSCGYVEGGCTFPKGLANSKFFVEHHKEWNEPNEMHFDNDNKMHYMIRPDFSTLPEASETWECQDGKVDGDSFFAVMTKNGDTVCMEFIKGVAGEEEPQTYLRRDGEGTASANDCQGSLAGVPVDDMMWYIRYPIKPHGTTCPVEGSFLMTYSLDGGQEHCTDATGSSATVNGDTVSFKSCYTGNKTYENPMSAVLKCLAHVPESSIGTSGNGDIVLLANYNQQGSVGRVAFHCARFMDDGLTVYLSLDIEDFFSTGCQADQRYDSAVPDTYVAVALSENSFRLTQLS